MHFLKKEGCGTSLIDNPFSLHHVHYFDQAALHKLKHTKHCDTHGVHQVYKERPRETLTVMRQVLERCDAFGEKHSFYEMIETGTGAGEESNSLPLFKMYERKKKEEKSEKYPECVNRCHTTHALIRVRMK